MFIWEQHNISVPTGFSDWQSNGGTQKVYLQFWWTFFACSVPFAVWNSRKLWLGLIISIAPFVVALNALSSMVEGHLRFFMHALPAVAVCVGVAAGGMHINYPKSLRKIPAVIGIPFVILILFLFNNGTIKSGLEPTASWRMDWVLKTYDLNKIQEYAQTGQNTSNNDWIRSCGEYVKEERQWYPTVYSQSR